MNPAPADSTQVVEQFARDVITSVTSNSVDEPSSLDEILPLVYDQFRSLATHLMRKERPSHTLRPTALANEAYLRLANQAGAQLDGQAHLLSLAATTMRRVLVDYARTRNAAKRGGGQVRVTLGEELLDGVAERAVDVVDLHRILEKLAIEAPRKVRVVDLLYFAGLTYDEAAEVLEVSSKTVVRDWRLAKAWLWKELKEIPDGR